MELILSLIDNFFFYTTKEKQKDAAKSFRNAVVLITRNHKIIVDICDRFFHFTTDTEKKLFPNMVMRNKKQFHHHFLYIIFLKL